MHDHQCANRNELTNNDYMRSTSKLKEYRIKAYFQKKESSVNGSLHEQSSKREIIEGSGEIVQIAQAGYGQANKFTEQVQLI